MTSTPVWSVPPGPSAAPPWSGGAEGPDVGASADVEPLDGDTGADVVVVGAGLTGLWTAASLLEADPALDVLLLDAGRAGAGASGAAVGWCAAGTGAPAAEVAHRFGADAARSWRAALRDAVVEVGGVAAAELIDCGFAYGGAVLLARTPAELARLAALADTAPSWGDEVDLLDPAGVADHIRGPRVVGGAWTPDCARLQPALLARGLVDLVTARGARLAEGTRAVRVSPGAVVTDHGTVRARRVVLATEGWPPVPSPAGPPHDRARSVTLHGIATEPLPADVWAASGLPHGLTVVDGAARVRLLRSADDRLVLGAVARTPVGGNGRWARLRTLLRPGNRAARDPDADATRALRDALADLVPAAAGVAVTHAWSAPVRLPADGLPSVGVDGHGVAWAGGYGADGLAAANLAGRTVADLLTGTDSALTRLPWVERRGAR